MTTDYYADPLVYDVLHGPGTAGEVAALRKVASRFTAGRASPLWLEPACGTARYLLRAAKFGVRGIGFDLSESMITYAQERARSLGVSRKVRLRVASMESFVDACGLREGGVDFAFNMINTIRHLPSDAAMLAHFAEVARVLRGDGVYAVGLSLSAYGMEPITEDTWGGKRRGLSVSQVVQYLPPGGAGGDDRRGEGQRQERVISHMTVRRGGEESHIDSTFALRTYNLAQWHGLVERSALRIDAVVDNRGADATAREPGYFVFVLRGR
jgi:SAM-dependent methyltransferase